MTNAILFEKAQTRCAMDYGTTTSSSSNTEYVLSTTGLYIPKEKAIIKMPELIIPGDKSIIIY